MDVPKFAFVFPPGLVRGAMAVGGALAFFEEGLRPEIITGSSGGGIAAASVVGWDYEVMKNSLEVWSGLTPKKISKMRLADDALIASWFVASLLNIVPDLSRGKMRYFERTAKGLISFGLLIGSLKAFLRQPSILSNSPLYKTIQKNLSFQKIFASRIKLIITSAKYNDGKRVVYTNFRPEDRDPLRLLEGLMESSTLIPLFEPRGTDLEGLRIDGIFANENCLALDLVEKYAPKCDYILAFLFYGLSKSEKPSSWLDIHEHTDELMARDKLEQLLAENNPNLPSETRKKIVIVKLDEQPKKIGLREFSEEDMVNVIEQGYLATKKVLVERGWMRPERKVK